MSQFTQTACVVGFIAVVFGTQTNALGQTDGIHRLLNRAEVLEARELDNDHRSTSNDSVEDSFVHPAAALVPSDHFSKVSARAFPRRQDTGDIEGAIQPIPLSPEDASARDNNVGPLGRRVFKASNYRFHPHSTPQEYVFDGNDRGSKIQVDQNFNIYGLDTEDTFGHFDTLDGQRIVVPSNRVAIYAPRLAPYARSTVPLMLSTTNLRLGFMSATKPSKQLTHVKQYPLSNTKWQHGRMADLVPVVSSIRLAVLRSVVHCHRWAPATINH